MAGRELELVVGRGLLRGTHLLARTPSLCPPGCALCEVACAERHGRARLSLGGTAVDRFDVVDTCRQCSVGAECVESCPEDAFERSDSGTLVITDRCTGCGRCVEACPYDAVASVPLPAARPVGGPLMGLALPHDRISLGRNANAVLVLGHDDVRAQAPQRACIRCGDCAGVCPVRLQPQELWRVLGAGDTGAATALGLRDCIECGCCAFVCPSQIPLVDEFRAAKSALSRTCS